MNLFDQSIHVLNPTQSKYKDSKRFLLLEKFC